MYVIKPNSKKRSNSKPTTVHPGTYIAEPISVGFCDKYVDDEAFRIIYALTDENGNQFDYSELFFNDTSNPRTMQYIEYCDDAGIPRLSNGFPDVIGCREKVVLKYSISYRKPIIVEREFIAPTEGMADELPSR